jgi:hypothetical protein
VWWGIGIVGFILWFMLLVFLGVATLRRGHWIMFIVGIFLPLFWAIGALIPPTERARLAAA